MITRQENIKHVIALIVLSFIFVSFTLTFTLIMPDRAIAKTVADYDTEIENIESELSDIETHAVDAKKKLASTVKWMYEDASPSSVASMIASKDSINETIDAIKYLNATSSKYESQLAEAKQTSEELSRKKEELEKMRDEQEKKRRSLANAKSIQFPQGAWGQANSWSNLPYWNSTVSQAGCGLVSYTVMIDILTGEQYTPDQMLDIRGDWRGMDGYVNDSTGSGSQSHHDFTKSKWDIESKEIDISVQSLKNEVSKDETVAIVCSHGNAFKNNKGTWRWSGGHFVCVFGYDDEGFHVSDSGYNHDDGTDVVYSDNEMKKMLSGCNKIVAYSN